MNNHSKSGQKNLSPIGIETLSDSPEGKKVRSTSGWKSLTYVLRDLASRAKRCLSTNSRILGFSVSPFTERIWYFNLVVTSVEDSLLIFFKPSISCLIFSSSFSFKSLNSNLVPDVGRVNVKVPLLDTKESLNNLFSKVVLKKKH